MTTVQNRHRYARLYLCRACLELAEKNHEVYKVPVESDKAQKCEVCGEIKKVQDIFTTAFNYGI